MILNRKLFLLFLCFAFVLQVTAQDKGKLISLKNVLTAIEKQHNVTFNYLDNEISNEKVIPPKKSLSLNEKINYLQDKTKLIYKVIDDKFISVHTDKKKYKISGYVYSKIGDLPLEGVNISFSDGSKTTTNSYGFFEIKLENYSYFSISHLGFQTVTLQFTDIKSNFLKKIFLDEKNIEIKEVLTNQFLTSGISKSIDGSFLLKPKKFGILPGLIEPDVLQTMLQLPGIYSTDESVSSINVRSGTHDQNLFLWNGIKMYQTGHFFGLISVFNPFLSNTIKIYKNGSSAFYGDGVSSVVDISTNPESYENNKFSLGLNMLNADVYAKINLSKNGFIEVAGRKSFTDLLKTPAYKQYFNKAFQNNLITNYSSNESVNYINDEDFNFYDVTTKYFQKIGTKNRIVLDLITIKDQLKVNQKNSEYNPTYSKENTLYQKNLGGSFSWIKDWTNSKKTFISIANSQYELDAQNNNLLSIDNLKQENKINDSSLKLEYDTNLSSKFIFNFGYQYNRLQSENLNDNNNSITNNYYNKNILSNHSLISEAKFKDTISNINISLGLRGNYIEQFKKTLIEPRFQFNYDINGSLNVNILGELKSQTAFQIIEYPNDYFGIEKRRWVLADNDSIPIQQSKQISIGANFKRNNWFISLENYYKNVTGITSLSQGFQNQYENIKANGSYNVKGIELLIQKKINHFITWITYNFNDSNYNFPSIGNPVFTNNFEIDNIISWAGIYEKNNFKFAIGSKWHSGKPETNPSNLEINNTNPLNPTIDFNTPNTKYLEPFFQVDASLSYKLIDKRNKQYKFGISVLNLLNRKNELNEYYKINTTFNTIEEIKTFSVSRTPNLSLRIIY